MSNKSTCDWCLQFHVSVIFPSLVRASQGCLLNHSAFIWEEMIKPLAASTLGWSYLILVLISVQLRFLFSWICWCFIYVGRTRAAALALLEQFVPLQEHFVLLHLCHTFATQCKAEVRRFKEMSACDECETQLHSSIHQKKHYSKLICHLQNHNPNKCFITRCYQLLLGPWLSLQTPNLIWVDL